MKPFKKLYFVLILLVTALAIGGSLFIYARQVNQVISDITITNMQEMAGHDKGFVENTLDKSVSNLTDLGARVRLAHPSSISELQTQLNREQRAGNFAHLFLVDDQGLMYSGTFLIQDGTKYSYVEQLLQGVPKNILRYDDYYNRVDAQEETLVYVLTMPPFTVEGKTFIGLVGQSDVRDVRQHMNLSSFDGQGSSMVIDTKGYYVVNRSPYNGIGQHDNLWKNLQEASFKDGYDLSAIQGKIKDRENFVCEYELGDQTYVLSMTPLDLTDWYLAMNVPSKVFTDRSRKFINLTSLMLAVILSLIASLTWGVVRVWALSVEARANADAKSDFLNKMSHEIRTPLNALTGLNYLMRQNLDDRGKLEEYLDKSTSTSQYLLSLINDILDISKLNQSKVVLMNEPFSLEKMLDLLQVMMKDKLAGKNITLTVNSSFLQPLVRGDEMRLKQVLLNILGNALKFTPAGGKVELKLTQKQVTPDRVITQIDITDNGIGMSKEFQHHIFESFTQEANRVLANREETAPSGTGLGMAISYLLMRQMQGDLQVTSTLGKGSCFTLLWPASIAKASELEAAAADVLPDKTVKAGGIVAEPDRKIKTPEPDSSAAAGTSAASGSPTMGAGAGTLAASGSPTMRAGAGTLAASGSPTMRAGAGTAVKPEGGSAQTDKPEKAGPKLHVLVAEDNDLNALILTSILKKENYYTELAKDGRMALEMFKSAAPFAYDVILMDAQMPIMDGYQAARSIRGLKREDAKLIRIYACTANTAQEYRDKALAAGMNGFVAKPIDVKRLLGLLEQIAAKRA